MAVFKVTSIPIGLKHITFPLKGKADDLDDALDIIRAHITAEDATERRVKTKTDKWAMTIVLEIDQAPELEKCK